MGDATIIGSKWRLVEVGRVVLLQSGPSAGRLATIVEIIDHKRVRSIFQLRSRGDGRPQGMGQEECQGASPAWGRVVARKIGWCESEALVDGPATDANPGGVARQSVALADVLLTAIVIEKLPRGARAGAVKAAWEKADVDGQWKASNWYKKRVQNERRKALTDFDRFKVLRLKKQRRFEERKALAKVKASA
ncbi:large subunit ribosomal protein L14e [Sporothrix schenckii 1099-18]|uniref:Large subunit ribosomal protein L14e n=1 Tax=Sporothrix schenckii 1099-18 TaxID=1397361 RepID=A0A0F2M3N9_SPOSC|nr:large subunit ribosomal protein L14e [Sporothrix schenckii 1099-18]KJR82776.1 large subunit ribosomal protein L14e [Sporothrix schenckii 1099-18]